MEKSKPLSIRISNSEFEQIESMKLKNETMSQTARRLLVQAVQNEREDIEGWKDLVARIENADISEISKKIDGLMTVLSQLEKAETEKGEKHEKYLRRITAESVRANIAIEELARRRLARSDFFKEYLDEVDRRLEEVRQKSKAGEETGGQGG